MQTTVKERLKAYLREKGISERDFAKAINVSSSYVNSISKSIQPDKMQRISMQYPDLNPMWLLMNEGEMLLVNSNDIQFYNHSNAPTDRKLIPFYDDAATIGGFNDKIANLDGVSQPTEYIDTGDWFRNATAAIRHYGDSMNEYPPGCILALKEVQDRRLIIPGKDYVIETSEYRVTKRIQLCDNTEYIRVHSTNDEKYDDGTLVHQPFNIPLELINRIYEVLGYVVKKSGGTIVFSNSKR